MLGLMDTVASVGFTNATGGEGHWGWATPENLQIHKKVKNCVHYVALHELRTVFPCDSVCVDKALPPNCHEHYYPGAHSDVGGGYAPGIQGKAWKVEEKFGRLAADDSQKLSQLPLNDMYQAAKKACQFHTHGQPWLEVTPKTDTDTNPLIDQFALNLSVRTGVQTYFAHCGIHAHHPIDHQLREHGLLYLTWRHLVTKNGRFGTLDSVHYSRQLDADGLHYYKLGQEILSAQITEAAKNAFQTFLETISGKVTRLKFNRNAKDIYKRISKNKNITQEIETFYDSMVHDSYAGFIKKLPENLLYSTEGEGYLRYRAVYLGDNTRLNATVNVPEQTFA